MGLKVAVVGVGAMGRRHARVFATLPGVHVVGFADILEEAAAEAARSYGGQAYTDYRRMLAQQRPDAVVIAVPTAEHVAIALDVIACGMHVLIEKPIAPTVAEGQRLVAAAAAADVRLMVGHVERFNPAVRALKAWLAEGQLGRVFQMDARRAAPFPERVGDVGVALDLAVHDLDVMRFVGGSEVIRVVAETQRRRHARHEDGLSGLLRFDNGSVGTLQISWLTPTKTRTLTLVGECGMVELDYLQQSLRFWGRSGSAARRWPDPGSGPPAAAILRGEPLRAELESFRDAVLGVAPVAVTGLDGVRALALAQAVITSGQEQRMVTV